MACRCGRLPEPAYQTYKTGYVDKSSGYSSAAFVARVNQIVGQLHADGTLKQLSLKYLGQDYATPAARSTSRPSTSRSTDAMGRRTLRPVAASCVILVATFGAPLDRRDQRGRRLAYVRAKAELQQSVYSRLAAAQALSERRRCTSFVDDQKTNVVVRLGPARGQGAERDPGRGRGSVVEPVRPGTSPAVRRNAAPTTSARLSPTRVTRPSAPRASRARPGRAGPGRPRSRATGSSPSQPRLVAHGAPRPHTPSR